MLNILTSEESLPPEEEVAPAPAPADTHDVPPKTAPTLPVLAEMAPEEGPAEAPAEAVAEGLAPWQCEGLKEQYYLFPSGSFTKFPAAKITGRKPNVTQYLTNIDFSSQPGYWSSNRAATFWAAVFMGHIKLPIGG
ncbi:hypothetical protein WJX77_007011 [Trebouxia sp. C0004]